MKTMKMRIMTTIKLRISGVQCNNITRELPQLIRNKSKNHYLIMLKLNRRTKSRIARKCHRIILMKTRLLNNFSKKPLSLYPK